MQKKLIYLAILSFFAFLPSQTFAAYTPPPLADGCCSFKAKAKYYCLNREDRHLENPEINFMDPHCNTTAFKERTVIDKYIRNTYTGSSLTTWNAIFKDSDSATVTYSPSLVCNNKSGGAATVAEICVNNSDKSATFDNNFNFFCTHNKCQTEANNVIKAQNTTPATASGLPPIKLEQKGLVTNQTGFFMDNCISDGNCSVCAVLSTFAYGINWMFKIGVLGAFLMITYFGIILLTSAGEEKKITKAKSGILGTLFGILVLFSGWTIVNTVLTSLITQKPSESVSIFNDGKEWFQYCK